MKKRSEENGVCEHCSGPATDGVRFCSKGCEECEHADAGDIGCSGICLPDEMPIADYSAHLDEVERAASPEQLEQLVPHLDDGAPWPTLRQHIADMRDMARRYPLMTVRPVRLTVTPQVSDPVPDSGRSPDSGESLIREPWGPGYH